MVHRARASAELESTYDVQLAHLPEAPLWARYPAARVHTTEATTVLRRASDPDQLDAFLKRVQSVGLVLLDVRRLTPLQDEAPGGPAVHEVRVKGVLGEALLTYLRWPHYVVPAEIWVRIAAVPADLLVFLERCTAAGAGIERIRLVSAGPTGNGAVLRAGHRVSA